MNDRRPLVMHVVYSFGTGGLEQVLLDTVHGTTSIYRHVLVSLTTASESQRAALPAEVELHVLNKKEGQDPRIWLVLWRLIKRKSPDIVHTYNFACLEVQLIAMLGGVSARIHAEHGRYASDPYGRNKKHRFLRRCMRRIVSLWVTVSDDLFQWLADSVGVRESQIRLIRNGIDTERFRVPIDSVHDRYKMGIQRLEGFCDSDAFVVGTVGRLDPVKNQLMLVAVYKQLLSRWPNDERSLVFAIVGDGPLRGELQKRIGEAGLAECIWLPGLRDEVAPILRDIDLFVLPSIAEGTPVTILEAMACGLPVVASNVGGVREIVTPLTGRLLAPTDVDEWAGTILELVNNADTMSDLGRSARQQAEECFAKKGMIEQYVALYGSLLSRQDNC